ncbi:hypothetical protein DFH09DRAFT_1108233 [Mycena vulgaris]|nr:hypothetical protein DFH09DRAFT_1108233 [Mycena vulgaris]
MDIDGSSGVPAPPVPTAFEPIETPMDVDSIPEIPVVTTKERRKSSRLHVEMDPQPAPSVPDEVGVISTKPRKRKATRTGSTDTSKVKRIKGGVTPRANGIGIEPSRVRSRRNLYMSSSSRKGFSSI